MLATCTALLISKASFDYKMFDVTFCMRDSRGHINILTLAFRVHSVNSSLMKCDTRYVCHLDNYRFHQTSGE